VFCPRVPHTGHCRFWTLLAGAEKKDQIALTIVDFARSKLIFQHEISVRHSQVNPAAISAVLDVLLCLDFEPRRQAARKEAELVASHMRIVFSVPKDRHYARSGYPSEPLLAEAAAGQMDEFQTLNSVTHPNTNVMAHLLESEFTSGLLDQGQRGEVIFRQLAWEAYRRAVREDHPPPHNFSEGCKLTTFIKKLFSEDYATQILNSIPDNVKSPDTFEATFNNAVIRFTHFGKMADDTGTTTDAMFAAFVRCMAIICWSSQEGAHILIPVLLDEKTKLEDAVMTGLLVQIKWRNRRGSVIKYQINQAELGFFPPDSKDKRPYITLVAELGVRLPISAAGTTQNLVTGKKSAPRPPKEPAVHGTSQIAPEQLHIPQLERPARTRMNHSRDVHPRYSIFAYGCSNKVYGVIS
jgi:hypothetical protein